MKVVQINSTVNSGSTGRIAEEIGRVLLANGHESYIAYGRRPQPSASKVIRVGGRLDITEHGLKSLLLDRHGFGSTRATKLLIKKIERLQPDAIGLHNLHGYYLNIEVLFNYLRTTEVPIVWTLHDCWPFTGHCAHFDFVGCNKWQTHCEKCPLSDRYPKSLGFDNSWRNFEDKRRIFTGLKNLTIVSPSRWLMQKIGLSFLSGYDVQVIHNGVNLDVFRALEDERIALVEQKVILGVASTWDRIKGLGDFVKLRKLLPARYKIVLIGLSKSQLKNLPDGIVGFTRTENVQELVKWYNRASVFVNPTYVDNFPTTNLEALACGTPVITYDTGGSPEALSEATGLVVPKGDVNAIAEGIRRIEESDFTRVQCRQHAEAKFDNTERFNDYFQLYRQLLGTIARS